jgi:hypothetical protein
MTNRTKITLAAAFIAAFATPVLAQAPGPYYGPAPYYYGPAPYYYDYGAVPDDGPGGNGRNTGYGQGGSAGSYPTGAAVGPGRAGMIHAN